ncbi:CHAT domain-containing protein [Sodalinema gerasimenkoae]|uniref:CHAT domain-containing protein n=1 Tax=Sodalinema gerasimenkoae TaxID=2862348 RepID=UPI00135A42AC|nr:CHAT domain-containing tetratricopeptide repeat protein [Sodalinema gerasimenkoae]
MWRRLWRWLKQLWAKWRGTSPPVGESPQTIPDFVSLSDSRYETLFFGLLDGVEAGWTAQQVAEHLKGRSQDPWFLNWLQRFRHTLMSSRVPNHELARRMVRLRGQGCDPVGETAAEIGEALLAREIPEEVEGESEEEVSETGGERLPVSSESEEEAEVWVERGVSFWSAGVFEEALESFDRALALNPNLYQAWGNRGNALSKLGRYEEALESCDRALALNPKDDVAWLNRGAALGHLGRYEEALESYDRALALNSKFDWAWHNRGIALGHLGRYEEALESCDRALALNPNDDKAWHNRGNTLNNLGRYEKALESCDRALSLNPNDDLAWFNRGNVLNNLERYEEALEGYDRALALNLKLYLAWNNRAIAISNLRHSVMTPLAIQYPQLAQPGYPGQLATYDQGLQHCTRDTNPKGWGLLHYGKGRSHYDYAHPNLYLQNRRSYFSKARSEYLTALETLTAQDVPESHLNVLRDLARVYSSLDEPDSAAEVMRQGTDVLHQYLDSVTSPGRKRQLQFEFADFQQATVDRLAQEGNDIAAWELAERGKNTCLSWWLRGWTDEFVSATAEAATAFANHDHAALIDWHCSPTALNIFLIQPGQPPHLLDAATSARERYRVFQDWWQAWNRDYLDYRDTKDKSHGNPDHPWRQQLPQRLDELKQLLDIDRIVAQLAPPDTAAPHSIPLILLPHKELHLLPLEALFPDCFAISRLPSVQTGLTLQQNRQRATASFLSIDPQAEDLLMADFESAAISHLYATTRLESNAVTPEAVLNHLQTPHRLAHFTGHSWHEFPNPAQSRLSLAQNSALTLGQMLQKLENLSSYDLVSLGACETGIGRDYDLVTEYVGWASGLLALGAKSALTSLWLVQSDASALLMVRFYELLNQGQSAAVARSGAVAWLRQLTQAELQDWYEDWLARLQDSTAKTCLRRAVRRLAKMEERYPYDDPYFWAAFVVSGLDEPHTPST